MADPLFKGVLPALVTPFRVMLRWGRFDFRVLKYRALSKRYADHADAHRYYLCGRGPDPGVRALTDAEAVLAEIDKWPLLPGEPKPIICAEVLAGYSTH